MRFLFRLRSARVPESGRCRDEPSHFVAKAATLKNLPPVNLTALKYVRLGLSNGAADLAETVQMFAPRGGRAERISESSSREPTGTRMDETTGRAVPTQLDGITVRWLQAFSIDSLDGHRLASSLDSTQDSRGYSAFYVNGVGLTYVNRICGITDAAFPRFLTAISQLEFLLETRERFNQHRGKLGKPLRLRRL